MSWVDVSDIVEALAAALPPAQATRFTLARKENGGVGAALNDARTLARGSHFGFLATDDWFAPEKIERQLAALDPPEGVVHTGGYNVFPDGEQVSAAGSYWPAQGHCFEDLLAVRVTCICLLYTSPSPRD